MNLLIGADPELFVRNAENELISGHGLVPGTKSNPYPVPLGAVQVDGMALEFNIEPAATPKQFMRNIEQVMLKLQSMIPDGYTFDYSSWGEFGIDYIQAQPEEARILGCDNDFNAYTGMENDQPEEVPGHRTAAGHIHLGWTEDASMEDAGHFNSCCNIVKELDVILGLPSLLLDPDGGQRRAMYGKAGAFRPKPYGVEYRVLSNFWLSGPVYQEWVFKQAQESFKHIINFEDINPLYTTMNAGAVAEIINQNNVKSAKDYVEHFQLKVPGYENKKSRVEGFSTSTNTGMIFKTDMPEGMDWHRIQVDRPVPEGEGG